MGDLVIPTATATISTSPTPPSAVQTEDASFSKQKQLYPPNLSEAVCPPSPSRIEYLDSLVVPSEEDRARIADVQTDREASLRRRSRELRRPKRLGASTSNSSSGDADARRSSGTLVAVASAASAAGVAVAFTTSLSIQANTTPPASPASPASLPRKQPTPSPSPSGKHAWKRGLLQRLSQSLGPGHVELGSNISNSLLPYLGGLGLGGFEETQRTKAAILIQRHYRGYRTRRELQGITIHADTRWTHALRELQYRQLTRPRPRAWSERIFPADGTATAASGDRANTAGEALNLSLARRNWKKVTAIALRAGLDQDSESDDDSSSSLSSSSSSSSSSSPPASIIKKKRKHRRRSQEEQERRRQEARTMGLQYFLEMVDPKHRYGANLRVYHEEWKRNNTHENFFYWLDQGDGYRVNIAACPRSQLEREQVRYLSYEERQYYLVEVDDEGRLCWAKNGARIDTTEQWKDSIHGIVPIDDPTPAYRRMGEKSRQNQQKHKQDLPDDASSVLSIPECGLEPTRAAKYTAVVPSDDAILGSTSKRSLSSRSSSSLSISSSRISNASEAVGDKHDVVHHLSAAMVFDALLRKSVQKNTWIFVADTSFRLYVGIKDSGTFQHSSFLQGTRISAAGLIRIHNGRLTSLSPLSGHYRPPASNFRAFIRSLKEAHVDTSHMRLSKSYAVLVGVETYMKTQKRGRGLLRRLGRGHKDQCEEQQRSTQQVVGDKDEHNLDLLTEPA